MSGLPGEKKEKKEQHEVIMQIMEVKDPRDISTHRLNRRLKALIPRYRGSGLLAGFLPAPGWQGFCPLVSFLVVLVEK